MLSKLLKYEYRATAIYFLPIFAMLLIVSGFSCAFQALYRGALNYVAQPMVVKIYSTAITLSRTVYVLLALALAVTTFIVIIMRFYKNLLGNEGYLMFTLPVRVETNILAKLIPAVTWFFGSCVLGFFTLFPALFGENILSFSDILGEISFESVTLFVLLLILFIAAISFTFLFYYLCMCIGQLFNSYKFIASAGVYIGIQSVLSVLFITGIIALVSAVEKNPYFFDNFFVMFEKLGAFKSVCLLFIVLDLVTVLFSVGLFFLDSFILRKKLNLT